MHSDGYFGMQITQGVKSQVTEGFARGESTQRPLQNYRLLVAFHSNCAHKKPKFNRYELLLHWDETVKTHT